jgi:hypothetical protein
MNKHNIELIGLVIDVVIELSFRLSIIFACIVLGLHFL